MTQRFSALALFALSLSCATTNSALTSNADQRAADLASAPAVCPPLPPEFPAARMEELRANAKDTGFLWRITKDGKSSFLYGTIHVGDLDHMLPGPRMLAALRRVQAIALELNPLAIKPESAQQAMNKTPVTLSAAEEKRIDLLATRNCVDRRKIAALSPFAQVLGLFFLEVHRENLFESYGSEMFYAGFAQGIKKPLLELETASEQYDALIANSADEHKQMLLDLLKTTENGSAAKSIRTLFDLWAAGDLDGLEKLTSAESKDLAAAVRGFDDRVRTKRNITMADKITELHEKQTMFVAVGSLHMTGDQGLPKLLAKRGFTVERITYEPTKL